jgi:uncharacterized membrane protein YgdD (TMEM256/DUF423 family)
MDTPLDRTSATFVVLAGLLLATAAALGAVGSHVLHDTLDPARLHSFELAVGYQFHHALGLLAAAWLADRRPGRWAVAAGWLFVAGILGFCGSIYARAFGAPPMPVPVAPAGGIAFMAGWIALAIAGIRARH